ELRRVGGGPAGRKVGAGWLVGARRSTAELGRVGHLTERRLLDLLAGQRVALELGARDAPRLQQLAVDQMRLGGICAAAEDDEEAERRDDIRVRQGTTRPSAHAGSRRWRMNARNRRGAARRGDRERG